MISTIRIALLAVLIMTISLGKVSSQESRDAVAREPECKETLESCVEHKRERWEERGVLGMKIHAPYVAGTDEHPPGEEHMASLWYVELIAPTGPAKAAGIRVGDQLLEWNNRPMPPDRATFESWTEAVKGGDKITVKLSRDGNTKAVTLTAMAAEPWVIESWLMDYVKKNYSEDEFSAYREKVLRRSRQR